MKSLPGYLALFISLTVLSYCAASRQVLAWQSAGIDGAKEWLAEARKAEAERNFPLAAQYYSKFLGQHPQRADILERLGLVFYLSNRFDKAAPPLERASHLDPALWGAELFLGASEYRMGQYGKALAPLQAALRIKPDLPEAHLWLGSALLALGRNGDANTELEKVPNGSSVAVDAYYMLAQGYRKAAESYYAQIQKVGSDSYRAHQLSAESYAWKGKYQNAILEYRKALQLKPDLEGAHRGIADAFWEQESFELADREYEAELRLYPLDDVAHLRMGEYRLAQGRLDEAIRELESALRINKSSPEACRSLGQAWMAKGELTQARTWLQSAVHLNPSDPLGHQLLGELYRTTGRPELAKNEQEIARELLARGEK